jgi:hypothetical protein
MNDSTKSKELEDDLSKLNCDIEDYCWNVRELSNDEKKDIRDLYTLWKTCLNKKIVIENVSKSNIRVTHDNLTCNGKMIWSDIKSHHSLYFVNCSDITIIVTPKVNHITLDRCNNINFKCVGGSISGIDIIKCSNITSVFNSKSVYFLDISNTTQCLFILSETAAKNIMMQTTNSYDLNFKTISDVSGLTKNIYKTNMNVFQDTSIYSFHSNDNNDLSLFISVNHSKKTYLVLPS